jgi:hypothetical protein
MLDFEKRKEKSVLNSQIRQEEYQLTTEQSKFIYDLATNNNNQINDIQKEIHILKTQMCDILNILNNKNAINKFKNKNNKNFYIEEKKVEDDYEIKEYINKEIRRQLNENIEILNDKLNLCQDEDYKSELDSELHMVKNELVNHEKLIISLKNNKVDKVEYDKNIKAINNNFEKLNEKIIRPKLEIKQNEDDLKNKNLFFNNEDLKRIKEEIYIDFEKINLKILSELKNQAYDIKSLYQELQTYNKGSIKNSINSEEDTIRENLKYNKLVNIINNIEKELSKKVNLEHLNYALDAQSKLNEALNCTSQICRMCWDSEGTLFDNKYIQWSSQNINTALNIFKWEPDSNIECIKILRKGVYKIVIGLIGLESDKNIKVCFNDLINKGFETEIDMENNSVKENNYLDWNSGNEKGNVKFIEKYFACLENTEIKVLLIDNENDNNDTSEEAFLELEKII